MSAYEDNMRIEVSKLEEENSKLREKLADYEKAKALLQCARVLLRDSVCPTNQVQIEWLSRRAAFNLEVEYLK